MNFNGHDLYKTYQKDMLYGFSKCNRCNFIIYMFQDNCYIWSGNQYIEFSCDEMIIKNIIE